MEEKLNNLNLSTRIGIRISNKTRERLERESEKVGINLSNYIRMILEGRRYRTRASEENGNYRLEADKKLLLQYEEIKNNYATTINLLNDIFATKLTDGNSAVNTEIITRAVKSLDKSTTDYVEQFRIFNRNRNIIESNGKESRQM